MAVLAPMPSASVRTATTVKPGLLRSTRREVVEWLLLLSTGDEIDIATVRLALPQQVTAAGTTLAAPGTLTQRVDAFERETILAELKRHQNHITRTARALGLERSYLYKKCEQLGIDLPALCREEQTD
jgi:two-component system, NtrC family, nitrogen regulation response regulator NtrX